MDLTGSLVDIHLKIFPSEKINQFLSKIPSDVKVPENISILMKEKYNKIYTIISSDISHVDIEPNKAETALLNNLMKTHNDDKDEVNEQSKKFIPTEEKSDIKDEEVTAPKTTVSEAGDVVKDLPSASEADKVESSTTEMHLNVNDLDWLYAYLQKLREKGVKEVPYLHQLLEGVDIVMPDNKVLKRNPTLEARCVKLRSQQEARQYRAMTKGVDNVRIRYPEDSIAYQMKQLNRQLIAVGQFLLSIFAGFLFGFTGLQLMIGPLDFGFRLLMGVMCALIIAIAEIYFLAKKLNEELSIPETIQLGGPPKFAKQEYSWLPTKQLSDKKPHQD